MRAVAVVFIIVSRVARVVRMRMRSVVVAALRCFAMVTIRGRLMVSERHALTSDNGRHALERHDERDDEGKQADEAQTHGRIVSHGV